MNKVILIGRLVKEPELRTTSTGTSVLGNAVAVERPFKNQNGEREADFINFVTFGATAELIDKYLKKGDQIALAGRIQNRNYQNDNGDTVYVTEVVAENITFLSNKKESREEQYEDTPNQFEITDDDLPF